VIDSPEIKHTDADIGERVPDVGLAAVARAYAKIIDHVNKLDRKDLQPNIDCFYQCRARAVQSANRTFYCSVDSYDCSRYRLEVRAEALERPWIWPFRAGRNWPLTTGGLASEAESTSDAEIAHLRTQIDQVEAWAAEMRNFEPVLPTIVFDDAYMIKDVNTKFIWSSTAWVTPPVT